MDVLFWGRATIDNTYILPEFPEEDSKLFSDDFILQPGGPALNAALTCSFFKKKCALLSRIGTSLDGEYLKEVIKTNFIELLDLSDSSDFQIPNSSILVNSVNGSRTIINSPKNNFVNIDDNWVINDLKRINPQIVLIDGYELENKIEILAEFKQKGSIIVLDGGSWKENNSEYLHLVDIAICSNRFRFPESDLENTITKLAECGINRIAFTNGDKTIAVYNYGRRTSVMVKDVDAVDTLGAGDVFHGAFCNFYIETNDFIESLMKASEIAGKSCRYYGTHTWQNSENQE